MIAPAAAADMIVAVAAPAVADVVVAAAAVHVDHHPDLQLHHHNGFQS